MSWLWISHLEVRQTCSINLMITQTWKLDPHPWHMFTVKFLHGLKRLLHFVSPVRSNLPFDEMGQAFIYCSSWAHRPGLKAWVILIALPSFFGVPWPLWQSEANPFSVLRFTLFFFDCLSYCYFMLIRNSSPHIIFSAEISDRYVLRLVVDPDSAGLGC